MILAALALLGRTLAKPRRSPRACYHWGFLGDQREQR